MTVLTTGHHHSLLDDDKSKQKKDSANQTPRNGVPGSATGTPGITTVSDTGVPGATTNGDDDVLKEEPEDFIETNCNWKECTKEFNTQDELVKVRTRFWC